MLRPVASNACPRTVLTYCKRSRCLPPAARPRCSSCSCRTRTGDTDTGWWCRLSCASTGGNPETQPLFLMDQRHTAPCSMLLLLLCMHCCSPDPDLHRRFFLRLETMQARISMHTGRVARRRRSSIAHRVPLAARHRLPSSRRRLVQARYSGRRRAGTPVISGRRHKSQRAYTVPVTSQLECRRLSSSTTCVLNSAAILNANSSLPFVRTNAKQYKLDQ